MAKRIYTDQDRVAVHAALQVYKGAVKTTARETGIPISTVRDWKTQWEKNGFPPELLAITQEVVDDLVEAMNRVRNKALIELERQLDAKELKGREVIGAFHILTDKIRLYQGEATSRTESVSALPAPEQIRELVSEFFAGAVEAAQQRAEEIDEAEWEPIPPKELPPVKEVALVD
jgi:transposase-like protein